LIRHIVLFIIEFLNPVWKLLAIKELEIKEPVLLYQNAQLAKCPAGKIAPRSLRLMPMTLP
jgi:hypothetical protein